MEPDETGSLPGETDPESAVLATVVATYLTRISKRPVALATDVPERTGVDRIEAVRREGTGNTLKNAGRELRKFVEWCDEGTERTTCQQLSIETFRRYLRRLRSERGLSGASISTYHNYLAGFTKWAVAEGHLDRNLARAPAVVETLERVVGAGETTAADDPDNDDTQTWPDTARRKLLEHLRDRVDAPVRGDDFAAVLKTRDLAFAATVGFAGVRGGELARDPNDDRRSGVRWKHVDFDGRGLTVLGKRKVDGRQVLEERPLPERAATALRRHRVVSDPPSEEWPVFPTGDHATLYRTAVSGLVDAGMTESAAEGLVADRSTWEILREHDLPPPAITTEGARVGIMKSTCEAAGIDLSDDHGYLTPHGGRRWLGEIVYRTDSASAAAEQLGNTEQAIHEAYSDVEREVAARRVDDVLDRHDEVATRANDDE